ncbi:hypothetical protein QVD17_00454 [Tagetes erecta]|uniref:RING-CH-type domain-containing protein n=1 Tax=Tagetes erecta TaxID=13708 RepID=A0AAD8L392_TARER|nr:hypothetical protein QVD17_00454 [Tagetes erecta]
MNREIELEAGGFGIPSDRDRHFLQHRQNAARANSLSLAVVAAPGTHQMKHDDVESGSMAFCRICFEGDQDEDPLISPCLCKGTQQFVHRSCLNHWRSVREGFAFSHCTTCKAQYHIQVVELSRISWPKIKFRLFVARDVFLVFLAIQMVIALMGGFTYLMDKDGTFNISLIDSWEHIYASMHPIPFYYSMGVLCFFLVVGFFGVAVYCLQHSNDPRVIGCQNFFFGYGLLDCFPSSVEMCVLMVIGMVIIFAILGLAYGFFAATMAIQRIVQTHYHILTKRELTQEYVVEDLHGCYTVPELAAEHVERLTMLKLM